MKMIAKAVFYFSLKQGCRNKFQTPAPLFLAPRLYWEKLQTEQQHGRVIVGLTTDDVILGMLFGRSSCAAEMLNCQLSVFAHFVCLEFPCIVCQRCSICADIPAAPVLLRNVQIFQTSLFLCCRPNFFRLLECDIRRRYQQTMFKNILDIPVNKLCFNRKLGRQLAILRNT